MLCALLAIGVHLLLLVGNSIQDDGVQKHWALLVAGSYTWGNYRHQADVCHAYHLVKNHGIPPEQIVVMMYDDIAFNPQNPFPGNIINEPDGPNLYEGVVIDYKGDDVNPEVFKNVLSGDSDGVERLLGRKGKVIGSGPKDRVFFYFADHGDVGLIGFPNDELFADDLNKVILNMHEKRKYKEMVIYIEACYSGSMFYNILKEDINVYTTTAANRNESSFGCYFDKLRQTYLGDVYSVNWMEDSDAEDLKKETLHGQFEIVKEETNTSHVQQFGDMSLTKLKVADFQGNASINNLNFKFPKRHRFNPNIGAVRSVDVDFEIMKRTNDLEGMKKLIELRDFKRRFFQELVISVSDFDFWVLHEKPVEFSSFDCYKKSIAQIKKACPGMKIGQNGYALTYLSVLANLCESDVKVGPILKKINSIAEITPMCTL